VKPSAVLITRNAAAHLERCLRSLDFCREIVVYDQGSDDGTVEICARLGARVVPGTWAGFGPTKAAAVAHAAGRWVLSVDADEEVSVELRDAVLALPDEPAEAAFAVNRLSRFLGRWIRHGGWHPDWVVRLFDRDRAGFDDRPVHESVRTDGDVGRLDGLLRHYTYDTLEQYLAKLDRYSTLAAQEAAAAGRRSSLVMAIVRAKLTFVKMLFLRAGWRDGWHGVLLALLSGVATLAKYVKIWQAGRS